MRRTLATTFFALLGGLVACSSDAPSPTDGGGRPGTGTGGLQVQLFTSNANPNAGACTLLQAIVTLNGTNVPDGTGVAFSTDFGLFGQNGLPTISIVTTAGSATTALCSTFSGVANVRASATVSGRTASSAIAISFQASGNQAFVTFCSPTFGSAEGGTNLTLNGGRFFGTPGSTRVTFTAGGVTREALVTDVTGSSITVVTPAFPEATSPSVPVQIAITLGANTPTPVTLNAPNCFAFGTAPGGTPSVTAVLPSSGPNEGNSRVSIIGSGFSAPVQVFFGPVEAQVLSVSYNQIVALTPPAFGAGAPNLNATVDVRVHEVNSGLDATLAGGFRFTTKVRVIAIDNNQQRVDLPFRPVTIHGQGFQAPVAVSLAGIAAAIVSVSATEIVVLPGSPIVTGCGDVSGPVSVTNIDTGDSDSALTFFYLASVTAPRIDGVTPSTGPLAGGNSVQISGVNFSGVTSVRFGSRSASFTIGGGGTVLNVTAPASTAAAPACPAGGTAGDITNAQTVTIVVTTASGCSATATEAYTYTAPCVVVAP